MSSGSETTTSSKLRQFGLYRTIDSRTEEFLKLSRKRQIRQGCACAAVSTIITITIVVSVVLVYDLSKDSAMSRRKANNLQWLENVNDTDMTLFDEKYSKANFNVDRASLKILPVIIKALNKNRFLEKIIEEDTGPQETTEFAYEKNVFSDVRNWLKLPPRLYSVEYKTSPIIYYKKPDNDYLTKVRKIRDYQKIISYLDKHMERKIITTSEKKEPVVQSLTTVTERFKSKEIKPQFESMNKSDTQENDKSDIPGINFVLEAASSITTTNEPISKVETTQPIKINTPTVIQSSCKCPKNLGEIINKIVSGFKIIMPKLLNMKHKCGKAIENQTNTQKGNKEKLGIKRNKGHKIDTKLHNLSEKEITKPYKGYQKNNAINLSEIMAQATAKTLPTPNNNPSMPNEIDYNADLTLDYLSNINEDATSKTNIEKKVQISSTSTMEPLYLKHSKQKSTYDKLHLLGNKQFTKQMNKDFQTKGKPKLEDNIDEDLSFQTAMPFTQDTNTDSQATSNTAAVDHKPSSKLVKWFREYKPLSSPFWTKYLADRRLTTPRYADAQKPITVTTEEIYLDFETTPPIKTTTITPDTTPKLTTVKTLHTVTTSPYVFYFTTKKSRLKNQFIDNNKPKIFNEIEETTTTTQRSFRIFNVQNIENTRQLDNKKTTHRFEDTKTTHQFEDTKISQQLKDTKAVNQFEEIKTTHQLEDTKTTHQIDDTKVTQKFEDTKQTTQIELTKSTKQIEDILLPSPQEIQKKYKYRNNNNINKTRSKTLIEKHDFIQSKPKKIITIKKHRPNIEIIAEDKTAKNQDRLDDEAIAERLERNEEIFDYDIPQTFAVKDDTIKKYPILPYAPESIEKDSNRADKQQSIEKSTEAQLADPSAVAYYGPSDKNFDFIPLANLDTLQSITNYEPKKPSFLEINNRQDWKRDDLTEFDDF